MSLAALCAAALLSQGEVRVSALAGTPYSSVRAERGFGAASVEVGADLAGFIRPVLAARVRLLDGRIFALSAGALAAHVFPLFHRPAATARTWDAAANLRGDLSLGPRATLLAQASLIGQTDFKAEHSVAFAEYLLGADLAVHGPLWLQGRGGVQNGTFGNRGVGWAGAALRW